MNGINGSFWKSWGVKGKLCNSLNEDDPGKNAFLRWYGGCEDIRRYKKVIGSSRNPRINQNFDWGLLGKKSVVWNMTFKHKSILCIQDKSQNITMLIVYNENLREWRKNAGMMKFLNLVYVIFLIISKMGSCHGRKGKMWKKLE